MKKRIMNKKRIVNKKKMTKKKKVTKKRMMKKKRLLMKKRKEKQHNPIPAPSVQVRKKLLNTSQISFSRSWKSKTSSTTTKWTISLYNDS